MKYINKFLCLSSIDENPIYRLFKFGEERIDHELNLIKLVKTVRYLKLFLRKELMNKGQKLLAKQSGVNVIDIDNQLDSNLTSSDESENENKFDYQILKTD